MRSVLISYQIVRQSGVVPALDRLSPLLDQQRLRARVFHTGPLCGVTTFAARPGRGFLHVLRRGEMTVTYRGPDGSLVRREVDEPTLLLYPRPLEHAFHNAPVDGSDFACATFESDAGDVHPLLRALPPVLVVPLAAVPSLGPALDLLFAEVDGEQCGGRLLADRLFEVVLIQLLRWVLDHGHEVGLPAGLLTGLADRDLAPALLAVHEAPGRPWIVASMAREAGLSRSVFAARFAGAVGCGPAEYLAHWRMTVAQERLRGGATVARTAGELGYATPAAFSRAFTQRVGRSPRAWLAAQDAAA